MKKTKNDVKSEKGGALKTFLSVVFFILILFCSFAAALCIALIGQNSKVIDAYGGILGGGVAEFLAGKICCWIAGALVIVWFILWIVCTKRAASAIRGLGVACSVAVIILLLCELGILLIVAGFGFDTPLTEYSDQLKEQFVKTSGKELIFLLSSMIIASVGIFICRIKKLNSETVRVPHKSQPESNVIASVEQPEIQEPVMAEAAAPSVPEVSIAPVNEEISPAEKLAGVCQNCGAKNAPDVKFCGSCGAKLL